MAINQLTVDADSLKKAAGEMATCANNIQVQVGSILQTVGELNSAWQGDAATSFINRFKELNDDMDRMMAMTNEYAKDLDSMADNYLATESANSELPTGLNTNVLV